MNNNKEETMNVLPVKENFTIAPKIAKRPIERPYERKSSNTNATVVQEPVLVKSIPFDDSEIIAPKSMKPKVVIDNNIAKTSKFKNTEDNKNVKLARNIGFENLPNQIYRRSLFNGFEFNLMVVGCSGLGKSTFVNSLFLSELYNNENKPPSKRIQKTVYTNATTVYLRENAVNLKLTLIDTPGFGDAVDNSDCWSPIVENIEERYNDYMVCQNHINRSTIQDKRVHVCLYFIEPTGHGLKPLDLEFMKQIHNKVNVVPIIAKADSLVPEECADFKKSISEQIKAAGINIYNFSEEAAAISLGATPGKAHDLNMSDVITKRSRQPFAIVSSNTIIEKGGNKVRGRTYPWGVVEVDNMEHNDFSALRSLLMSTHLQDLRDHTNQVLFENFRFEKLSSIAQDSQFGVTNGKDPMSQMDDERRESELKIKKMEEDMELLFEQKVEARKLKYLENQQKFEREKRNIEQQLENELRELENRRIEFESERLHLEEFCRDDCIRGSVDNLNMKEKSKSKNKWLIK